MLYFTSLTGVGFLIVLCELPCAQLMLPFYVRLVAQREYQSDLPLINTLSSLTYYKDDEIKIIRSSETELIFGRVIKSGRGRPSYLGRVCIDSNGSQRVYVASKMKFGLPAQGMILGGWFGLIIYEVSSQAGVIMSLVIGFTFALLMWIIQRGHYRCFETIGMQALHRALTLQLSTALCDH